MNAPANFQRFMENTLEDYRDLFAMPYLDDCIVYSNSFLDHMEHIRKVLKRFQEKGVKLKLSKCGFFKSEVEYLGRVVNSEGYRMNEASILAVQKLKEFKPENVGHVRQLLGLLGYHRKHIQDFAKIAKPITNLLLSDDIGSGTGSKKEITGVKSAGTGSKTEVTGVKSAVSSRKSIDWKSEHQMALDKLIDFATSPPILAYPDFTKPFLLYTDASGLGLGCILYQEQEGKTHVIGYGSRTLKTSEANYHSSKLEFLALKWAITEHFHNYLAYSDNFTVYTDNNPLLYVMENSKLNAISRRWISELSEYKFSIKFRPGVVNKDADCLSRIPLDIRKYKGLCKSEVELNEFEAIVAGIQVQERNEEAWYGTNNNGCDSNAKISSLDLQKDQEEDIHIAPVIDMIRNNVKILPTMMVISKISKNILRERKKLFIDCKGVLRRKSGTFSQVVLPEKYKPMIFEELHCKMGHLGAERVFNLARQRVYWPNMYSEIEIFTQKVCKCNAQKKPHRPNVAPLQSIISSSPMELVSIDFLHLEESSSKHEYILLIVDHFTRYAVGYPCKNKSAVTAAKHLYNDFVLKFGLPGRIMHDQGREFENKIFASLEGYCGVAKSRTTPYHPQTNGTVERMNSTLLKMLRTLPEDKKKNWHLYVDKVLFAYNSTRHDSTGFSPHFLLFGREPILPLDLMLGIEQESKPTNYVKFVENWKLQMQEAYKIAKEKAGLRKSADEKRWQNRLIASTLKPGDKVLIKNVRETGGPGKIRTFWEQSIYKVMGTKGPGDVIVTVRKEDCPGEKERVVHRNMLMPCEMLEPDSNDTQKDKIAIHKDLSKTSSSRQCNGDPIKPDFIVRTRNQRKNETDNSIKDIETESSSDSSDPDDDTVPMHQVKVPGKSRQRKSMFYPRPPATPKPSFRRKHNLVLKIPEVFVRSGEEIDMVAVSTGHAVNGKSDIVKFGEMTHESHGSDKQIDSDHEDFESDLIDEGEVVKDFHKVNEVESGSTVVIVEDLPDSLNENTMAVEREGSSLNMNVGDHINSYDYDSLLDTPVIDYSSDDVDCDDDSVDAASDVEENVTHEVDYIPEVSADFSSNSVDAAILPQCNESVKPCHVIIEDINLSSDTNARKYLSERGKLKLQLAPEVSDGRQSRVDRPRRVGSRTPSEERLDERVQTWKAKRDAEVEKKRKVKPIHTSLHGRKVKNPPKFTYDVMGEPSVQMATAYIHGSKQFPPRQGKYVNLQPTCTSPPPISDFYPQYGTRTMVTYVDDMDRNDKDEANYSLYRGYQPPIIYQDVQLASQHNVNDYVCPTLVNTGPAAPYNMANCDMCSPVNYSSNFGYNEVPVFQYSGAFQSYPMN